MCYFVNDGVLMRKYRPRYITASDKRKVYKQIVVPSKYRPESMERARVLPTSGLEKCGREELGKICPVCQMVGKPNYNVRPAPVDIAPAFDELFCLVRDRGGGGVVYAGVCVVI